MELRATSQKRGNERLDRQLSKKAETRNAAPATQTPKAQTPDRCTLSRQALAWLEQQNALEQELAERRATQQSRLNEEISGMESKKKQLELLDKAMKTMRKCMKIAASIMKGSKVPPEDLEYLMKNDPDGYKMALALRRDNPDPKEEKSVLDDEDRNGGSVDSSGGAQFGPSPAFEASAPESSGGEASGAAE